MSILSGFKSFERYIKTNSGYQKVSERTLAKDVLLGSDGSGNSVETEIANLNENLNNVKKSVSDGKSLVASAITEKGVETASDATFETIASNISNIETNIQEATIYVHGASFHQSSYGANQKGARGKVTLPNLGWTKAVCTSATSSSKLSISPSINGNVSVGSEKDISSLETITLQVTSNATGSNNLYGSETVEATFVLS